MTLADLESHASPEAVELARAILEQDVNDRMWADQVGPALAQRDVARSWRRRNKRCRRTRG
jgi:hypothetical protein